MLSSNPIAGFFDSQYLWKEDIDNGDFFHEDIHTVEVASKTITFKCLEIPGTPKLAWTYRGSL